MISKACSLNDKFLFGMLYINLLNLVWFWSRIWGFYKFWSFKSWGFWYLHLRLILILHLKCFLFRFMWFFFFLFLGIIILILFHVLNCLYCYYYEKVILLLKFETWCYLHGFQNQTILGGWIMKTGNQDENRFFKPKELDFLLILWTAKTGVGPHEPMRIVRSNPLAIFFLFKKKKLNTILFYLIKLSISCKE